jgi:hypothetical protein
MMFFNNLELKSELANAKYRIAELERYTEQLNADLARMRKEKSEEVLADVQSSTFVIDWKNMDVFSVERMGDDGKEAYTILGYWVTENGNKVVSEWKFYCSHEQHEKLAKQFEAQR